MVSKVSIRTGRMSRAAAACDKCTTQCVTVHGNANRSADGVNGFFKIMYGKDCSEFLRLPPKFARTVQHLVGQDAELQDSNAKKWNVKFSNISGFLSLREGWAKFFSEHNLESGDVLVFNCMTEKHFIVHIYDKSACRIHDFAPRRPKKNKRCKSNPITADKEDDCQIVEKNSRDKPNLNTQSISAYQVSNDLNNVTGNIVPEDIGNSQIQSTSKNLAEDQICMPSRDTDYPVEERNHLCDLSLFEMKKTTFDADDFKRTLEGINASCDDTEMSDGFMTSPLREEPSDYGNCSHDLPYFEIKKPASDANDFGEFLEEAITPNDDTEMIDGLFVDQFNEKLNDDTSFITSMQLDANLSPNDGGGIMTSVAESRIIRSSHVLEPDVINTEQVSSIQKELVESREKGTPIHESLPNTSSQYSSPMLINISPAEQVLSLKKEVLESDEKDKAPTNVSLPIASRPFVCSMLNFAPVADHVSFIKQELVESSEKDKALTYVPQPITSNPLVSSLLNVSPVAPHVSSIKKELVESREKDMAPTHLTRPIISTPLLRSMLNTGPDKHGSSLAKDLVELRNKGQAPTSASLLEISTHLASPMVNIVPGNLSMKSGQTSAPAVKTEPGILYDTILPVATTSFSAQVKSLQYLELPECIPLPIQQKGDLGQGRVVFLRDPSGKLWPVLHPDLFCVKAFTGNWKDFCEANHVKPGDVCQFQLESNDSSSCIYRVDVQKSGQ